MIEFRNISADTPEAALLETAKRVLADGGLVIMPTETVYGVACDPSVPGALAKLIAAKGRDGDKPIARLASGTDQVRAEAKDWSPALQALAEAFWPGPLTIVLETAAGFTGYRVPDHAVPIELAKACGHTLALTSANPSGGQDPHSAREAAQNLKVDLVLDSGPTAQAVPSTVVKTCDHQIECLREGSLPFEEVERVFMENTRHPKKILFICTGNTCRSPMAQALFEKRIGSDSAWTADSAGIFAGVDAPASMNAVEALRELDIDLSGHRSKPVTAKLLESTDMIVTMTAGHRFDILQDFPEVANKVCLIKSFGTSRVQGDICDPFGGSLNEYRTIRDEIDRALADLILFMHEQGK
ncbi:MAG: Sua5/YciO/YrdC/YwlC family protein [Kiritimatiellales bacterium]|nr:Sua5/YciO/YrdC/YwlC family protein [Kiritimatiellales bacterium]